MAQVTSPKGIQFDARPLQFDKVTITHADTGKSIVLPMNYDAFVSAWEEWQRGAYLQVAFAAVPAELREFLLTAITPDEWKEIFADEENQGDETRGNPEYEQYCKEFPLNDPRD